MAIEGAEYPLENAPTLYNFFTANAPTWLNWTLFGVACMLVLLVVAIALGILFRS